MGPDVIDHAGRHYLALLFMSDTEWMLSQPAQAGALPCTCVSTLMCGTALPVQLLGLDALVLIASTRAVAHQDTAARMGAGTRRSVGHEVNLVAAAGLEPTTSGL